jgi:transposase, IS30 family
MSQSHLTIHERESILKFLTLGKGIREIARLINSNPSVISREIKRNSSKDGVYSAVVAQEDYKKRRLKCRKKRKLNDTKLKEKVRVLFFEKSWSPEQISHRLKLEGDEFTISYASIYRSIYSGEFDDYLPGDKKATRKLRHRGKTRKKAGSIETRGKIKVTHTIHERPKEADNRNVIGHWEADTVVGKTGSSTVLTIVDRSSRFLIAGKLERNRSILLKDKMIDLLKPLPKTKRRSITPDRGKEFSKHSEVTEELGGIKFYFADPHSPWQRGTNENTNGLIREYLPKGQDFSDLSDEEIDKIIDKINKRPRKCLGWKSPHEVFFKKVLHLT